MNIIKGDLGRERTMNDIMRNEMGGNKLGLELPAGVLSSNDLDNKRQKRDDMVKYQNVLDYNHKIKKTNLDNSFVAPNLTDVDKNKFVDLRTNYEKLELFNGHILVRVKVSEPKLLGDDIILWESHKAYVPTKSGMDMEAVDNPWPFIKEAVVVNKADSVESVSVGDKVILAPYVIEVVPKPGTPYPQVKAMFTLLNDRIPTIEDVYTGKGAHFGYLLVTMRDIIAKIDD